MSTISPQSTAPTFDTHEPDPHAELLPAAPPAQRSPVRRGARAMRALASDVGQGTVEYVGLLLLMATILAAIVGAAGKLGGEDKIGKKVVEQIGNSIDKAGSKADR